MDISIPQNAENIIKIFTKNGYEAFVVGGCVRDSILGREPEDWDITTSARPEVIKSLFHRTIDTGIQHGTVTIRMGGCSYEATTYRIDGEYEDNRHPKQVEFTSLLTEDLRRRDFTINAMAYNPTVGLVDEFHGIEDLENRIIRCVGDPKERFDEDALRTLRAIRFAAQLDFNIEDKTLEAIKNSANNIKSVSAERIRVEMTKLLLSKGVDRLIIGSNTGLFSMFLPEWDRLLKQRQTNPHHIYNVGMHTIKVIENVNEMYQGSDKRDRIILCWSALLHDIGKPDCFSTDDAGRDHFYDHPVVGRDIALHILQRMKFDNYTVNVVTRLIQFHDMRFTGSKREVRKFLNKCGMDIIDLLFILMKADVHGQSNYNKENKLQAINQAEKIVQEIRLKNHAITVKDLKINGSDLIEMGIKPGKDIGILLNLLLDQVLESPERNERETLLFDAKEIYKKI